MSIYSAARRKAALGARHGVRSMSSESLNLSPEKMRALVAIYHQAETFITRENLDKKIDEAFTSPKAKLQNDDRGLSMAHFHGLLSRRQESPSVTEWNQGETTWAPEASTSNPEGPRRMSNVRLWSTSRLARDAKVIEALYGVETLGGDTVLPGLDYTEDNEELLEQSAREDAGYEERDY